MRAAEATKTTTVTEMAGGTNNNLLKAIRGSGRNGCGGGSGDSGDGNVNSDSNQDGNGDSNHADADAIRTPLEAFFLRRLLLLSRLLFYSSSCCTFRRPLSSCHPPVSMTALPPPSSLRCPNASRCKMLTSTLVSNASFWWRQWEEARGGGEHNNQPKEGREAKMPATEATQQATTSWHNKRTKGWRNNDDAVERNIMCAARWSNKEPS